MTRKLLGILGTLLALSGLLLLLLVLRVEDSRPPVAFDFWFPALLESLGILCAWLTRTSVRVQRISLVLAACALLLWGLVEGALWWKPQWFLYSPDLLLRMPLAWCGRYASQVLETPAPIEMAPSLARTDGLFYTYLPEVEVPQVDALTGESFLVRTDAQGYRNAPETWSGLVSAVFLGDGATFGIGARKPFPEAVSQRMGMPGLNLGVGGHGPHHMLEALKRSGLAMRPGWVVVCLRADDVWNAWAWRDLSRDDDADARRYLAWPRHSAPGALDHIVEPSASLSLLRASFDHPPRRVRRGGVPRMEAVVSGQSWSLAGDDGVLRTPEFTTFDLQPTLEALHDIRFRSERQGARVLLTWVPPAVLTYSGSFLGGVPVPVRTLEERWGRNMERIAYQSGIPFVDPLPALQNAAPSQGRLYVDLDGDLLSDAGHEVLAGVLLSAMSGATPAAPIATPPGR